MKPAKNAKVDQVQQLRRSSAASPHVTKVLSDQEEIDRNISENENTENEESY